MKWTNRRGLPETIQKALEADEEGVSEKGDYRVSDLLRPARMVVLSRRYADKIEQDVGDWGAITQLMGRALHYFLSSFGGAGTREGRLSVEVAGKKVTGKPDLVHEGVLTDYKVTSVWHMVMGNQKEWEEQLNCYAELIRAAGEEVTLARAVVWLRDWQASKATDPTYPQEGNFQKKFHLWSRETAQRFMRQKVEALTAAEEKADAELPECTPDERWERPAVWAVIKAGAKRALVLYSVPRNGQEAEAMAYKRAEEEGAVVQYRPGQQVRCESWCPARHFCPVGQAAMARAGKTKPTEEAS